MAVDHQDLLESVIGDALGDVQAESDERLRLDVDGAGEVDVVQVQPVGDRRQHQHLVGGPAADFQTDRFAQEHIDIQRQMLAVLLGRGRGQNDQFLRGDGVVHLGPGKTVVAVLGLQVADMRIPRFGGRDSTAGEGVSQTAVQPPSATFPSTPMLGSCRVAASSRIGRCLVKRATG